jgi:hypothetical protein
MTIEEMIDQMMWEGSDLCEDYLEWFAWENYVNVRTSAMTFN